MRAKRIDDNQVQIVRALRRRGVRVISLAGIGNGVPDLLVARGQKMALVEIKDGQKPPSARKLTALQQEFHALWSPNVATLTSVDEIDGFLRRWL